MPEQGTKPQNGTALMGIDPATGIAYFIAVDPATGQLVTQSASGGDAVTIADGADVTLGAKANAKSAATDATPITIMSVLKQISFSIQAAAASLASALTFNLGSPYPSGAVPVTSSVTGTTGAAVATLPGVAVKTTYICGFTITSDATAAIAGAATVAGTVSGSLNYIQNVGAATAAQALTQNFNPPIPASAANTAITVTSAAAGVGGNTAVTAWGYQL